MRNAVCKIDCAINRINHPAVFGVFIARIAFFSEQRDLRKRTVEFLFNQLLAADIQFELDVVGRDFVRLLFSAKILLHERPGGFGGRDGYFLCCW